MEETNEEFLGCEGMNCKLGRILGARRASWKGGLFAAPRSQLEAVPVGKVVDGQKEGLQVN